MPEVVRAALVQAGRTGDTESMIVLHETHARRAAGQGAKAIGSQEVIYALRFRPEGRLLPEGRHAFGRAGAQIVYNPWATSRSLSSRPEA